MKNFLLTYLFCCLALISSRAEDQNPTTPADALPAGKYRVITSQQIATDDRPATLTVGEWNVVNENGEVFLDIRGERIPFQFTDNRSAFLIVLRSPESPSLTVFSGKTIESARRFVRRDDAAPPRKEFSPFEGKFWSFYGSDWDPKVGSFRLEKNPD